MTPDDEDPPATVMTSAEAAGITNSSSELVALCRDPRMQVVQRPAAVGISTPSRRKAQDRGTLPDDISQALLSPCNRWCPPAFLDVVSTLMSAVAMCLCGCSGQALIPAAGT
eukprot:874591-Prymnesium_polylepis.2